MSTYYILRGKTILQIRKGTHKALKQKSDKIRQFESNTFCKQALKDFMKAVHYMLIEYEAQLKALDPKIRSRSKKDNPFENLTTMNLVPINEGSFAELDYLVAFVNYKLGNFDQAIS